MSGILFGRGAVPASLNGQAMQIYHSTGLTEFKIHEGTNTVDFRPVTQASDLVEMKRFVQGLEDLYRRPAELRATNGLRAIRRLVREKLLGEGPDMPMSGSCAALE